MNVGLFPELDDDDCVVEEEEEDVTPDDETGFRDPCSPDLLPPPI